MRILIALSVWLVLWPWAFSGSSMPADRPDLISLDTLKADTLAVDALEPPGFFVLAEDSLKILSLNIVRPTEDSVRLANNQLFANYLLEVLYEECSMHHPFDSLITVSMLQPSDSSFRIITWYVPLSNQQFRYFGYIQYGDTFAGSVEMPYHESGTGPSHDEKTDISHDDQIHPFHDDNLNPTHDDSATVFAEYENGYPGELTEGRNHKSGMIFKLREDARFAGDVTSVEFTGSNWYGSYYYELITNRHAGEDHYVLLGWRGDNAYSRKRIVEPLSFRDGEPVFGAPVFDLEGHEPYRLVFEYSVRVSMGLLYDELYSKTRQAMTPMIVFDRLMPMQKNLKGQHQHYVPEGEVFDGLIFRDGKWLLEEDVDARNRKQQDKHE